MSKSPQNKNFFLPSEVSSQSPLTMRPSFMKIRPDFSRIREKQLKQLESDLDQHEIRLKVSDNVKSIEQLFQAYMDFFEGTIQSISSLSNVYKTALNRAKNGFSGIFKKIFPKVKHLSAEFDEKHSQTLMTITPGKYSVILSKLGDIINEEVAGSDRLEKFIQKNFILNKRKQRVNNAGVQTEYKVNNDGVISYEFKSYEQMSVELDSLRKINEALTQEKEIMEKNLENLGDTEKLVRRNKVLESIVIKMRNSGGYKIEDFHLNDDENQMLNNS
jgi:hypothetical protein